MTSALPALLILVASTFAPSPTLAATHPIVSGYERLRSQPSEQAEAGAVLLSEFSCLACHGEKPDAWKPGPDLQGAGRRLRADYLRAFIANPAQAKPGTTMPSLLASEPEARRAEMADDLTHYLMQLAPAAEAAPAPPAPGDGDAGKELFYSIGCIACHAQVPLERLADKYAPGELARFIEKPLAVRPAARMPDLHLTADEARHLEAWLAPRSAREEPRFVVEPTRAQRGRALFHTLGCANCHGGAEAKPARKLHELDPQRGCLSGSNTPGVPRYPLADEQRAAIRAAIPLHGQPLTPAAEIRRTMLERNCFACHIRGGLGGPAEEVAVYFSATKDDLGDLGRLPPPLDGVGRKLLLPALQNILQGQQRVRTYMRTRMPDFGPGLAEHLALLLANVDEDPNEKPTIAAVNPNQVGRNDPGRTLVGTTGYACIACHELHGHASLGIGAYDLAEMPKRLRPEWMRDFLLNPAAFPTGTRMPAFFPNGKPMSPKLGTAEKQIDSIRVYLTEVDQSLPPEGIIDHAAFELKPAERPLIFRTFIAGVGTHAIAVGFPGGINVAFDARTCRWAVAWRGRFLDADGTWNQRVAKMEKPLGDNGVNLDGSVEINLPGERVFKGYRVDKDGVPTFLYDIGDTHFEDRIEALPSGRLERTLKPSQPGALPSIRIHAQPAPGVSVTPGTAQTADQFTALITW